MQFFKYQSLGNDFIVIDSNIPITPEQVKTLCNRHYGIGADGVLLLNKDVPEGIVYNSDGSKGEMCLNGIRCLAKHLVTVLNHPRDAQIAMANKAIKYSVNKPSIITTLDLPSYIDKKTVNYIYGTSYSTI